MSSKNAILAWNGVALAGGIVEVVLSCSGAYAPIDRSGLVYYCIPLALLGFAEWLIYREHYGVAALLMFVGGLGTVPIGLLAIIGSLAARRMRLQVCTQDESALPCVRCGYDLRGASVPRCPECGYIVGKWDGPRGERQQKASGYDEWSAYNGKVKGK